MRSLYLPGSQLNGVYVRILFESQPSVFARERSTGNLARDSRNTVHHGVSPHGASAINCWWDQVKGCFRHRLLVSQR